MPCPSFTVPLVYSAPRLPCPSFGVPLIWCAPHLVCPSFGVPLVWCAPRMVCPSYAVPLVCRAPRMPCSSCVTLLKMLRQAHLPGAGASARYRCICQVQVHLSGTGASVTHTCQVQVHLSGTPARYRCICQAHLPGTGASVTHTCQMCWLCVLQHFGVGVARAGSAVCGGMTGEYSVHNEKNTRKKVSHAIPRGLTVARKRRDWRYYLCCCTGPSGVAASGNMVFLHGVLYLQILEGRDLPDVDVSWFRSTKDVSDPYVTVDTCTGGKRSCRIAKTSIIYNSLSPHWHEKFRIEMCHEVESFLFSVKDLDLLKVECMGYMNIRAEDLLSEEPISGWYPLMSKNGDPAGALNIMMHFKSVASITRSNEVLDTVFPMRGNCNLKLYQDAHTPAVPPVTDVPGQDGEPYDPPQLWKDLARHLEAAKKLIYITGWSVKTDISLERDGDQESIGELLKRKSEEGVRVLLLVWNEMMSTDVYTPGVMGTHDEDTRIYFEGSEVEVVLAPRTKSKAKVMETNFVSTCYTHHQKSVILDVEVEEDDSKRRLVAYVGGLDLTDGRWDTPDHPLFRTLPTDHSNDFYNGVCPSKVTVGPRQPWHDIHALVDGPAALDVHDNFVERWRCQAQDRENRLYAISSDVFDLDYESLSGGWNCQLFRSINSDSAQFRTDVLDKLLSRKGRLYENSIQRAYVHHIRRSNRFIFIENQYFLGSSHGWLIQEAKCTHLVPVEIVTRITRAIDEGEDYRAYILVPIHPEGDPGSGAVQEILYWQYRTMEMMYRKIAKMLKKVGSSSHPTDYLSFFCLGKRESAEDIPDGLDDPDSDTVAEKARTHMRFMIYVHSKMMIVDDEYIIIGSANINERSMNGNRDTEMAIGAFETEHTKETMGEELVQGAVHTFRRALWAEHCGEHREEHIDPSQLECMHSMRSIGEENLQHFVSEVPEHRDSHLMLYPIDVSEDGHVKTREDCPTFPDTPASILGAKSSFLPNSLTT
ncbi:Phospholipase D/Transphosphatidylase [Trinorchestia longiramus]|nr:Phospholipase D/Transphosphatidylase [Trinorchestia longiramus]